MRVGTDGVLLGAWFDPGGDGARMLDVGTGTGVIALMAAQRNPSARIDAVEIDAGSCADAAENFAGVFKQYSDKIEVIWCVQSLVDTVMEDINRNLSEQINTIRDKYRIEEIGHICSDRDKDILNSCDAYYGDISSVVQEYRNADKPVMIMNYEV